MYNREASQRAQQSSRTGPQPFESSIANPHELSLFRSFRPSDPNEESEWYNEPRSPYRVYIGIVLVLMIGGLIYMGWRSTRNSAQNTHEPPPAASTEQVPAASAPSNAITNTAAKQSEPANSPASAPENAKATEPAAPAPKAQPKSAPSVPAPEPSQAVPTADNGSTELAEARRYLGERDSSEASKWLWKSIAKHNGEATLMLADLYLKGDGVSKNCDQARVLLDSAARKGIAGAGERLRNLQAFGCQ